MTVRPVKIPVQFDPKIDAGVITFADDEDEHVPVRHIVPPYNELRKAQLSAVGVTLQYNVFADDVTFSTPVTQTPAGPGLGT